MKAGVGIVDCGGANIASLMFALERLGVRARLTAQATEIASASHVILPGVGSAADAMSKLHKQGLADCLRALTQPVLGICLGLQLLAESSEEDDVDCLGILPGAARKLRGSPLAPVPNMGWCRVQQVEAHPLFAGIADHSWFYFLHSYALPVNGCSLATATHSVPLTAVAGHRNFLATQFHPERSSAAGARLLQNFLAL